MYKIFTTEGLAVKKSFQTWRDALHDQFVPAKQVALSQKPFAGKVEGVRVGELAISRVTLDAMRTEITADTIRRHNKQDTLALLVMLNGQTIGHQYDR